LSAPTPTAPLFLRICLSDLALVERAGKQAHGGLEFRAGLHVGHAREHDRERGRQAWRHPRRRHERAWPLRVRRQVRRGRREATVARARAGAGRPAGRGGAEGEQALGRRGECEQTRLAGPPGACGRLARAGRAGAGCAPSAVSSGDDGIGDVSVCAVVRGGAGTMGSEPSGDVFGLIVSLLSALRGSGRRSPSATSRTATSPAFVSSDVSGSASLGTDESSYESSDGWLATSVTKSIEARSERPSPTCPFARTQARASAQPRSRRDHGRPKLAPSCARIASTIICTSPGASVEIGGRANGGRVQPGRPSASDDTAFAYTGRSCASASASACRHAESRLENVLAERSLLRRCQRTRTGGAARARLALKRLLLRTSGGGTDSVAGFRRECVTEQHPAFASPRLSYAGIVGESGRCGIVLSGAGAPRRARAAARWRPMMKPRAMWPLLSPRVGAG
jgi:hypothetical protein